MSEKNLKSENSHDWSPPNFEDPLDGSDNNLEKLSMEISKVENLFTDGRICSPLFD